VVLVLDVAEFMDEDDKKKATKAGMDI